MEIRYFQIIIPLLAIFMIFRQWKDHTSTKVGIYETIIVVTFWIGLTLLSFFPDFFTRIIAKIFGIRDNVNAIIFFALGLLFYFQLQLYKIMRKQDEMLTELTRKMALKNPQKIKGN